MFSGGNQKVKASIKIKKYSELKTCNALHQTFCTNLLRLIEISDRIPETTIFECELVLTCLPDDFIESETASDINTDVYIKKASGKTSTDLLSFSKCQP